MPELPNRFSDQSSESGQQGRSGALARLSDFSIRYPVTICMILTSLLVMGAVSMRRIPLVLLPSINEPFIGVVVPYPNATPDQIQETITRPLEEVLSTIPHISRISSTSTVDQGSVELFFDWNEDIDFLRSEVRARVEQARKDLPRDVQQILVRNFSTNDIPIIEGRIASGRDLRGAYDFLDLKIKKPLERVAGVAGVEIGGVDRKEIEISLRLNDLKRYQVDVDDLFGKLDSANLNVSMGLVREPGLLLGVKSDSAVGSLEELRNFPVNSRGLKLADIAEVEFYNPSLNYGRHLNGEYAISLEIRKASDANTVETVDRVMSEIEKLNDDPSLQGIEVLVWHNSGKEITKSLSGLLKAGLIGALLAIGVLYLFLRRIVPTLVLGFVIPFSIVAGIGFLYLLGNSLNVLSMMGLMLSTGMLVDNAVVVLESILRHIEAGKDRVEASLIGTREVVMAVLASTLTSVIIFVPLVFGKKSELSIFLGHTGAAIIITLFCSLFISLTLIPLAVARFVQLDLAPRSKRGSGFGFWLKRLSGRMRGKVTLSNGAVEPPAPVTGGLLGRYLALMQWTLRHRVLVAVASLVLVGTSFAILGNLPDSSPEAEELRDLSIDYSFSESYHYAKIEQDYVDVVEAFLFENKDRFRIKDIYSYYENNSASTRLYFDAASLRPGELTSIRREIGDGLPVIPGAEIRLGRQEGAQTQTWIGIDIYGDDSNDLQDLASEARKRLLANSQEFTEVYTELEKGKEEVQVVLNRERARKYGVSPESVSGVLGIVLRGRRIRGFRSSEGEVDIWVKLRSEDRKDLKDLKSMAVGGGNEGQSILLSQVADFSIARAPGAIQRENRQTFTRISANYMGDQREKGKARVTEVMEGMVFPEGYGWNFGFWTLRQDQENQDFLFNLLLALFMVYFVMASLFESLAHPFAIMISLLFAFVGVAWFLLLTGTPFNIMAMIGVMILIGIVVNNGIVLIDHVNNLRRDGMSRPDAILSGCRERFRPILMTASTTVVGLLPLAVGTTSVFDLRYFPMARTVMGGLIASTILTLIVLPTVYTLVDDLAMGLRRIWSASGSQERVASDRSGVLLPDPAAPVILPD